MIWIEKPLLNKDKFCCLNCNKPKANTKDLKISVGDSYNAACVITLCKECRDKLKAIL